MSRPRRVRGITDRHGDGRTHARRHRGQRTLRSPRACAGRARARRDALRCTVRRGGDRPPRRNAPPLPPAPRARAPAPAERAQLPRQHLRAEAARGGVGGGHQRRRQPEGGDRARARGRPRPVHRPHLRPPEHLLRRRHRGPRPVRRAGVPDAVPDARRLCAHGRRHGARRRRLRLYGGAPVLDPGRVPPLPELGRARDRHDQPAGGEARPRGRALLRYPGARHRLRLLEHRPRRGRHHGRAAGALGQRRSRAPDGGGGGARAAGAHRLSVPRRTQERHHHRAVGDPGRRAGGPVAHRGEVPVSGAIAVVGSVAFDTIETPTGRAEGELGGSATHFAVAASYFAPVQLVAVVGEDFPAAEREFLAARGIDLSGLEVRPGRTFRWTGRYHEDLNVRDTLALELNVFADFRPRLNDATRRAPFVFLANIDPTLQEGVLAQFTKPTLVACDTMNHWIQGAPEPLKALLPKIELLILTDEEARLLSGESNVPRAARRILALGPRRVLIKRGEYGAILFSANSVFAVPAYPLEEVFDPTGAGDSFAGGLMGHLASTGDRSEQGLRRAIVYGSVLASFIVEDFGGRRFRTLTRDDIERRYRQFVALTEF